MASRYVQKILIVAKDSRIRENRMMHSGLVYYHSAGGKYSEQKEEDLSSEWIEKAYLKLKKLSPLLKELDSVSGRLVNTKDGSRIFDDKLEHKMQIFKSISRVFIGLPTMQETMTKNVKASFGKKESAEFQYFSNPNERVELKVNSLTKVADILNISAQQRKVVRHKICRQVTQHKIWAGALDEILNGLKSEIDFMNHQSKETRLAHQIVVSCLKLLESSITYDPESTSWMRLTPTKGSGPIDSPKWEDILEMTIDLTNCLSEEKDLALHVSKLELMKEGLYQIKDVLIDKNIGYKDSRHQENLVQKKLSKSLGHSSPCLFTLLLYYLYGSVGGVEVEVRGGLHALRGENLCLYMGKILTFDDEKVVRNGVKQLDQALGLFKFVWESAGMKGDLEVQGHLWCVGGENRWFKYRGNMYFVHGMNM